MKLRVGVVGGGPAGLIAAFVCRLSGAAVKWFEPGKPGGNFTGGGLKYFHDTEAMRSLFALLDIEHSTYTAKGGILLRGEVLEWPRGLKGTDSAELARIREDHYRKTRRTEPTSADAKTAMNDAEADRRAALRCDPELFVRQLVRAIESHQVPASVARIRDDGERVVVTARDGAEQHFDRVITTAPLWASRQMVVGAAIPECMAARLNVALVDPRGDRYSRWDYVYTPYTPANLVHRLHPKDGQIEVEFNGDWVEERTNLELTDELNFLFPAGWGLAGPVVRGLPGHLLPLDSEPVFPERIRPLGRFAQWNPRATVDVVLDEALALARAWGLHPWI